MECLGPLKGAFGCHWCDADTDPDPKKTWVVWCFDCAFVGATACESCYRKLCEQSGKLLDPDPEPPEESLPG